MIVDEIVETGGGQGTKSESSEDTYTVTVNSSNWRIPKRYSNLQLLGSGSFGAVCSATNRENNTTVAIKKLYRPFFCLEHGKRTLREFRLLKHFAFENVISLLDSFSPDSALDQFKELYFVTQYMESDLGKVIKNCQLEESQIKYITLQILRALRYIHSAGVIHRDLTPSNIALSEECDLRILDFGLAREMSEEMTGYVTTRWYRAPEVMLNWSHYANALDIWSCGCIVAEMFRGTPLFPEKDAPGMLRQMIRVCGTPDSEFFHRIESTDAKAFIQSQPFSPRTDFAGIFPKIEPDAIDLIRKMLEIDPERRITAEQALSHPYFNEYLDVVDVPKVSPFCESIDENSMSIGDLKRACWELL